MFPSLFVVILGLCYCSNGSSQSLLGRPLLSGPSEVKVNSFAEFRCELLDNPSTESILLQLFKEGDRDRLLAEYTSLDDEVASFPVVVRLFHEGNLECVAKVQNNSNIQPTVSNTHHLRVVEPVEDAKVVVLSGSSEFLEGKTVELLCELPAGNHVSYEWLLNGQAVSSPSHHAADGHLSIHSVTSEDSGSYMCVASNNFNKTEFFTFNSSEIVITVKDLVSKPKISFTVLKEHSNNYSAVVSCESAKGAPPVSFSLYNGDELVANVTGESKNATFKIPLVLGRHLGWLQCRAHNGDGILCSERIPLHVVPVGGPVVMQYSYDVGGNYAVSGLRFSCKAKEGSLPRYQWFLNKTLLQERGSFSYVVHQPPDQSILLLSVGRSISGTYHCEVSDSFDNSTAISSNRRTLDEEVLNRLPVLVVAVVFGCFTFLVLLVCACCAVGVVFRPRQNGEKSLLTFELDRMIAAYEGELELSEYAEDGGMLTAASDVDFDQVSAESVDEWQEKSTLEDEAAEEP